PPPSVKPGHPSPPAAASLRWSRRDAMRVKPARRPAGTAEMSSTPDPNRFARELFGGLPAHYDSLAELLSFGQNRRWRRFMVDQLLAVEPSSVLDVATGTAGLALLL